MPEALFGLLFLGISVFAIFSIIGSFSKADSLIEKWAQENGYRLVEKQRRALRRGPFWLSASKYQVVYHVEVVDRQGSKKTGWVCCGSYWSGMSSDKIQVKWDDRIS